MVLIFKIFINIQRKDNIVMLLDWVEWKAFGIGLGITGVLWLITKLSKVKKVKVKMVKAVQLPEALKEHIRACAEKQGVQDELYVDMLLDTSEGLLTAIEGKPISTIMTSLNIVLNSMALQDEDKGGFVIHCLEAIVNDLKTERERKFK